MIPTSTARFTLVLLTLVALASRDAAAQANPDSVKHRNNCRLASQVVADGNPDPKRNWAYGYIKSCLDPDSRAAILAVLARLRTSSDTSAISNATAILPRVRDGEIFAAMLAMAGDKTASVQLRVFVFMAFYQLRDAYAMPEYWLFVRDGLGPLNSHIGTCAGQTPHAGSYENGATPMPVDFLRQIRTLARRVLYDQSEPMHVRSAAACLG